MPTPHAHDEQDPEWLGLKHGCKFHGELAAEAKPTHGVSTIGRHQRRDVPGIPARVVAERFASKGLDEIGHPCIGQRAEHGLEEGPISGKPRRIRLETRRTRSVADNPKTRDLREVAELDVLTARVLPESDEWARFSRGQNLTLSVAFERATAPPGSPTPAGCATLSPTRCGSRGSESGSDVQFPAAFVAPDARRNGPKLGSIQIVPPPNGTPVVLERPQYRTTGRAIAPGAATDAVMDAPGTSAALCVSIGTAPPVGWNPGPKAWSTDAEGPP